MPRGRGGSGLSFTFDVSDVAIEYTRNSIKDMPGNPGQKVLVKELSMNGYMLITVTIEPGDFSIECVYDLKIHSNHPEAIEQIIKKAYDTFSELGNRLDGGGDTGTIQGGLDYLTGLLRQDAYDYAASNLN